VVPQVWDHLLAMVCLVLETAAAVVLPAREQVAVLGNQVRVDHKGWLVAGLVDSCRDQDFAALVSPPAISKTISAMSVPARR
jgi:hypothetical protein